MLFGGFHVSTIHLSVMLGPVNPSIMVIDDKAISALKQIQSIQFGNTGSGLTVAKIIGCLQT